MYVMYTSTKILLTLQELEDYSEHSTPTPKRRCLREMQVRETVTTKHNHIVYILMYVCQQIPNTLIIIE